MLVWYILMYLEWVDMIQKYGQDLLLVLDWIVSQCLDTQYLIFVIYILMIFVS